MAFFLSISYFLSKSGDICSTFLYQLSVLFFETVGYLISSSYTEGRAVDQNTDTVGYCTQSQVVCCGLSACLQHVSLYLVDDYYALQASVKTRIRLSLRHLVTFLFSDAMCEFSSLFACKVLHVSTEKEHFSL